MLSGRSGYGSGSCCMNSAPPWVPDRATAVSAPADEPSPSRAESARRTQMTSRRCSPSLDLEQGSLGPRQGDTHRLRVEPPPKRLAPPHELHERTPARSKPRGFHTQSSSSSLRG